MLVDTYVTDADGTGIVHQAPAFGEDDHRIAISNGVLKPDDMPPCPVDDKGHFTKEVPDFAGLHVKVRKYLFQAVIVYITDCQAADSLIQKALKSKGRLIVQSTLNHSYPFCWRYVDPSLRMIPPSECLVRSGTPLIYRAIPAWFVKVTPIIDQLVSNNEDTRWVPQHVGENRFGNWLANARDWNISRNRYWGTPIPLWVSDDMEEVRFQLFIWLLILSIAGCLCWLSIRTRGAIWHQRHH